MHLIKAEGDLDQNRKRGQPKTTIFLCHLLILISSRFSKEANFDLNADVIFIENSQEVRRGFGDVSWSPRQPDFYLKDILFEKKEQI